VAFWILLAGVGTGRAVILWSDLGATLVHDTGAGSSFLTGRAMDVLGGAVKADETSTNTLYFKFHVDPLSDVTTEEYFAGFQLYEGNTERLGVGNSLKAWAYSAFNTDETGDANKVYGDMDLRSSTPEKATDGERATFEFPRRGYEKTIVFKVEYVAGGKDRVTVWLDPDLTAGATEEDQPASSATHFTANCSFSQIRLRHGGGGGGWTFSDMAIATSFGEFVASSSIEPAGSTVEYPRSPLSIGVRTWQREEGFPQTAIQALAQTRDGYLWLGTDEGVVRFDGLRFVPFGVRDGLKGGAVRALCGDSRGALWIGGLSSGLSRWLGGDISNFTVQDGLPSDTITALAEDREGRVWVGTDSGLVLWRRGSVEEMPAAAQFKGRNITCLFRDKQGDMWLGVAGAGVFRYHDGSFAALTDGTSEAFLQDPHCLLVDQNGRVWIGAGDDYVLCRDGDQWRRYRIPRHMARPYVDCLAEEPDGTVWAGSISEGLFQFSGGKLATFNAGNGLLDNQVQSLLVDREGKLWVGTETGLNRLRRKILFPFGQNDGLGAGPVQGSAEVAPGIVLVAKPRDGLYRWDGRRFERLPEPTVGGVESQLRALLKAQDGGCWAAGAGGLMYFKDATGAMSKPERVLFENLNITALAEDAEGWLWFGTAEGGVWRGRGTNWIALTNLVQASGISAIVPESKASVWIATGNNGLVRFRNGTMTRFNKSNGLLSDSIRTLYLDPSGKLWVGTAGGGLSWVDGGRIRTITTHEGIPDNTIVQILEDSSGRLWLGCPRGIVCVSKRDLNEFAAERIPVVYPKVYGMGEGMLSEECTGGYFPAGLKTKAGLLWISTTKGVVVADARPHASDSLAPRAVLEEFYVDGVASPDFRSQRMTSGRLDVPTGEEAVVANPLKIPPGRHHLEFRYTGLSFDTPERIRFRYRLEGLDSDWVEAGTRRVAIYNYVPPGEYRFRVVACNSDGVWGETGDGVSFVVQAHLWQAWWVLLLGAFGLLALVVGVARIVEKRKLHRRLAHLEQERIVQRERARIAQDLHDDLGSSLARISLLSGLAREDKDNPAQVETHVNKIAHSAAQTVQALEEIVWAVRPGSDSLQSLVEYIAHFANEMFDGNTTRCRLDLPHDLPALPLPPDVRHNIFLVVKEALTNTLKHASATEVRVQVIFSANILEIVIQDDGKGFDSGAARAASGRNGLGNMQRRVEVLGGALTVQSQKAKGTTVKLTVDISKPQTA
jgi:signal transduction histidine kinase/ligand-binding sensor domain-containing protein